VDDATVSLTYGIALLSAPLTPAAARKYGIRHMRSSSIWRTLDLTILQEINLQAEN